MHTYIAKRLLLMIPTLFGVSLVVWGITAAAPEPPVTAQQPGSIEQGKQAGEAATLTRAKKIYRAQFGLDKPAILNFHFSLDIDEVEEAVRDSLGRGGGEDRIRNQMRAREQIVKWGYYSVPALVEVVGRTTGVTRYHAMQWLVKNAERVTRVDPSQAVDDPTAKENARITGENRVLKLLPWPRDADEKRITIHVTALQEWYHGARERFGNGRGVEEVAQDLSAKKPLGRDTVAALVEIATSDGPLAGAAAQAIGAAARSDDAPVRSAIAAALGWEEDAPAPKRAAAAELVKEWWEGASTRWDYGGTRWLRVLFLETRFASYWGNLLRLDLGFSSVHKEPVVELIMARLKYSLTLALSSMLLAFLISVPLGLYSARTHGTVHEKGISILVFILYSLPSFFVATLLIRYLAQGQSGSAELIPTGGFESADAWTLTTWDRVRDIGWHIITPIICMTYASLAGLSRYAKTGLLNVIRSDYVRTARAKGLSDFVVTYKHAARPGIIPVITLLGGTLPVVVSGSFIIEWIFQIPGFGLLMVDSVKANDYNVIVGVTLVTAVLVMIGILLSDLLYAVADPRISLS